jgi:hypothetical protein
MKDNLTELSFPEAFNRALVGDKIQREGWNGNGLFVEVQNPDDNSKMGVPYLFIDAHALGGKRAPWVPSQTDLFATDWRVVE